jgi:phosphoribosylformylglycinamidine synthase
VSQGRVPGARPAACIITGYGINADEELAHAFCLAGAEAELVHVNDLLEDAGRMDRYRILAFPGGFSFGDHLGSGLVFAGLCRDRLKERLERFIERGNLVLGVCNGFQVLVRLGILPNLGGEWTQEVSLVHNRSGVFEDRWVRVRFDPASPCAWTRGLREMELPVRHGEGRLVATQATLDGIEHAHLAAVRYASRWGEAHEGPLPYPDNPNGSERDLAGICDATGRVFGLMPHPEAFIFPHNHPRWTREEVPEALGLTIFRAAVDTLRGG